MLSDLVIRMRYLLKRKSVEHELDDELRFHFDQQVAKYIASGMRRDEAMRRARLEFGGLDQVKEECRDARGIRFLETLAQDVRYGLRMLRKSPGFTIAAVLTLALGIGANTAIFSMVDTLMLRPLPIQNPSELTFLAFPRGSSNFDGTFSAAEFRELDQQTQQVFSASAAMIFGGSFGLAGQPDGLTVDGITRPVQTVFVSGSFFEMLGIRPYIGRFILPQEGDAANADPVVVLSYRYWKARFRGDPAILNKAAFINGRSVTIVGIAPKDFLGVTPIVDMEAYLPLGMTTIETGGNTNFLSDPKTRYLLLFGRLKSGLAIERANTFLRPLGEELVKRYPRHDVSPELQASFLRPPGIINGQNPMPKVAALFFCLSALVLVLACLNVANLSLVRVAARRREMAVRGALGGTRSRLTQHLLVESLLLALLGSGAGMAVGALAVRAISNIVTRLAASTNAPIVFEFPFNPRVFLFGLAVATLTAMIVGIVPAIRASGAKAGTVLHDGGRTSTGRGQRMRTALVAAQVGGSLALLIVAGLFVRSLRGAQHSDLGFDPHNVLNVALNPAQIGYTKAQGAAFYDQLLAQVRALPEVQSASLSMMVPFGDNNQNDDISIPGYTPHSGEQPHAAYSPITTQYLSTMRIPLLQGRDFRESDNSSSPHVALINQAMAARFWPNQNPVGRSFTRSGDPKTPIEIVGVVRNSRFDDVYSPFGPLFYVPASQNYTSGQTLQIRTAASPTEVAPAILALVRSLAPPMPVLSIRTMQEEVEGSLVLFTLGAQLTGALGLVGLVLAIVGVYGVMAYAVGQRTNEIGIRVALGAQRSGILWMICRQGIVIVAIGLGFGFLVAFGAGQLAGDLLVGVRPVDPLTYSTVTSLLTLAALAACYIPAHRATRVDPMIALRHE